MQRKVRRGCFAKGMRCVFVLPQAFISLSVCTGEEVTRRDEHHQRCRSRRPPQSTSSRTRCSRTRLTPGSRACVSSCLPTASSSSSRSACRSCSSRSPSHRRSPSMFPYALLLIAVCMYVPALFWRFAMVPLLSSDIVFIMEELDKSYNRSVRLAQHIVQRFPRSDDANNLFYDEVDRARRENYFEFPLLEKYLACKRDTRELLWRYVARNLLVLLLMLLSCLYLVFYHTVGSVLDEFSCNIKTGLLANDSYIPGLIQCKLTSVRVFYVLSLINISVYALASTLVFYNVARLWWPDPSFLDVYEMLPSFEVLGARGGGGTSRAGACRCLPSDLSVILLFLGANVHELKSYKRLVVFRSVRPVPSAYDMDTLVDTMTILAGFEMSRRGGGENAGGPGSSEVDGARVAKDAKGASRQQQQQKQMPSPTDSIRNKLLRQRQQDQNTASTNV
ncbi:pannexin-3-like isoform X3 [Lethenteron reissneri]|uniref:pannexin-3-like isoform X3 n=1 Tax=Lethenteron reissneri TaxID=7753 RepID=UPI002AB78C6F|nr:pannexin-3-like isoform X3 [Lethenteron reissneri]